VPPEATEAISYRMPTFKYKGPLLGFAAFSNHCSLFPMSYSVIEAFKNELKDFHISKGTIRFPVDKPLPTALVKKLVKARIAENEHRKQRRSGFETRSGNESKAVGRPPLPAAESRQGAANPLRQD
jgi:uncharacterized protein YdhG (YjbR/CyaY superfamily)